MVDIDERVVQMKFDATDFDQNTKKTMSTLDKLREKLSFKDVVDNNAMNTIADNVQKVADKAYTIVDRTIDKIKDNIANKLVNFIQENTVGQLTAGWNKYADMTTSVATLTGQGYGLKQINEQLERLMYFTDETSFKFTDMVGEIGKFTASGQSLEDATTAMMGIAEWAALSGKNANEASRAMYQLSQALGAGQMRLVDWKSIQNLNMDTREFRQNAIDAAIAVGTLKDNLDGTYTTLVGKKKGSLSFNIREFSDKLTEGAWFTTEVMMEVYSKYSEAVDDIRDVYENGYYFDADNNYVQIETTAQAVKEIKKSNNELIKKFTSDDRKGLALTSDQISQVLAKWKQVAKVVNHVNDLDEEGKKILSDEDIANAPKMYAEYLKEYSEIFQGTEEDAERALNDWEKYVAEFGMKAFEKSFEAKTFVEAIESAKDAASTVWVSIYQDIFGDYEQAKEIWTDLANTLYELFVSRLWDLEENIIGHWRTGGKSTLEKMVKEYEAEIMKLENTANFGEEEAEQVRILREEIDKLNDQIENGTFRDGRKIFMQGIYGFGSGLKSVILNFRKGWDSLFTTGETGEKLLNWSEKLRVSGFKFYLMMQELAGGKDAKEPSPFYKNIAAGIKNLFAPIAALRNIIHSVIQSFLPSGETFISILNKLAYGFANLTAKIVPSQETVTNIARVLRGIIAFIKLIGKAVIGFYNATLKPIISFIYEAISETFGRILELFAEIGDKMYTFEEGLNAFQAMEVIGGYIKDTLMGIWYLIKTIIGLLWRVVGPVLGIIYRTIKSIVDEIKQMSSGTGGFFGGLAEKFKDVAKRAHDAWFSVNSFKDVFNAYSDQKGLPAFLMMVTDMFDTLITKIGTTILAIFGLDTAVSTGKMSKGLQTLRDIIADIAIGLKWIYTNVIRPILGTLIEGLGNSLHNLGEQWRSGDLKGFLGTIREIIGTFTSIGLFKFVGTINKVFGAGGLLRVFRNTAKTIKQIGHWFSAKVFNEISGGILKLAIAFTILVGAATALTFLPEENMAKMNSMMITFAIALGVVLIAIFAISKALKGTEISLWGFASAMFSIVAVVGIFIFAIAKLHKALTSLFQIEEEYEYTDAAGNTKTGTRMRAPTNKEILARLLSLITPVVVIIGGIAAAMAIIKALGGAATLMQFGITIAGLGIGMYMLVNAVDDLLDIFSRKDKDLAGKIAGATIYILGLMAILALISRLLTNPKMMGSQSMSKSVTGALVMCITIAGMALVVRGVLIPTLETLADSSYSFLDYVGALIIIAGGMFTIAGVLALMSKNTGSMLNKIGAGIVFILFAKVLQNVVVPLIETFNEMNLSIGTFAAVLAVAAVVMTIAGGIRIIFNALAEIMKAVATLQAKQLVPIILSIGITIAGIMWLCSYLKKEGSLLNAEEIGLIIASIGTVILLIGLFAVLMNREFGKSAASMQAFSKLMTSLTVLIGVIALSIGGLLVVLRFFYEENTGTGIAAMLAISAALVVAIGVSLLAFSHAVSSVTNVLSGKTQDRVKQIITLFKMLFISIGAIMLIIVAGVALIGHVYKDNTAGLIFAFLGIIISTLVSISASLNVFASVVDDIATVFNRTGVGPKTIENIIKILKMLFIAIGAIMLIIITGVTLITGLTKENVAYTLVPALEIVGGTVAAFKVMSKDLTDMANSLSKIKTDQLKVIQTTLLILFVTIAGIMAVIAGGIAGIIAQTGENADLSFVPAVSIVLGAVGAFTGIAKEFEKLSMTLSTLQSFNLKNIIATMGAILVITGLMSTIMVALMNWMAGTGVGGEQNLMNAAAIILAVIIPFAALAGIIELMIPTADLFVGAAAKIAGGIFLIGASISVLAASLMLLKEAFGIGQSVTEGVAQGIEDNAKAPVKAVDQMNTDIIEAEKEGLRINSPSKVFAQDGKYIDQGLAQGIKKDTPLAEKAAAGLAVATNKSFQKELKIASPSKVFYENGKFVIRGFINGAQSEYQKNKDMGAAMGEGFADSALEGMKDGWAGLWDGEEMDDWIKKFSEEGGLNFGEKAGESLLAAFLGTDTTADENALNRQLTAQEQYGISQYEKAIENTEKEIEELQNKRNEMAIAPSGYFTANDFQKINDDIAAAKKKLAGYQKSRDAIVNGTATKKTTGGFLGSLGGVFEGFGEEFGNIMSSSMLGSIGQWFGEGGEGLKEITGVFDSALGTAGDTGATAFTSRIFEAFGLDKENNDITEIGKKVGKGLVDGIGDAIKNKFAIIAKPIVDFWHSLPDFLGGLSDADYEYWLRSNGLFDSDENTISVYVHDVSKTDDNGNKINNNSNQNYISKEISKYEEKLRNATSSEEARGYQMKINSLKEEEKQWLDTRRKYMIETDEYIRSKVVIPVGSTIDEEMEKFYNPEMNNRNAFNYYWGITDDSVFANLDKGFETDIYHEGEYLAQMYYLGFDQGWLKNENGVLTLVDMTLNGFIQRCKDILGINSPSTVAEGIGSYFMQGIPIGIDEEIPEVLSSIDQATDLITDETIAGLNGMQSMLDHEITPTITPVFDSSTLTSGVDTINSALDSVQPTVESAIGSFGIESTDYTNNLTSLQNRIDTLTGVVDSFMTMIESGAGVNVKVSAEPDPTNIYNLVVDVNKQEFKRTGRNNFAF